MKKSLSTIIAGFLLVSAMASADDWPIFGRKFDSNGKEECEECKIGARRNARDLFPREKEKDHDHDKEKEKHSYKPALPEPTPEHQRVPPPSGDSEGAFEWETIPAKVIPKPRFDLRGYASVDLDSTAVVLDDGRVAISERDKKAIEEWLSADRARLDKVIRLAIDRYSLCASDEQSLRRKGELRVLPEPVNLVVGKFQTLRVHNQWTQQILNESPESPKLGLALIHYENLLLPHLRSVWYMGQESGQALYEPARDSFRQAGRFIVRYYRRLDNDERNATYWRGINQLLAVDTAQWLGAFAKIEENIVEALRGELLPSHDILRRVKEILAEDADRDVRVPIRWASERLRPLYARLSRLADAFLDHGDREQHQAVLFLMAANDNLRDVAAPPER